MVKKKILFIITQSEFGGAQRFLSTFVPRLDRERYEALVATGSTGDKNFTEHLNNLKIPNMTLRHLVRNPHPWHDILAIFEIKKLIEQFQPQTLFLLSTKAGFVGSLTMHYALSTMHLKVIYRIGGWAFNDPQNWLRRRLIIWAEKLSAHWKDVIIVNNKHDLDQAKELEIRPREKLELIYNGLDSYKIKFYEREKAREKLGLAANEFAAGTIAHDYPSKGLKYLPKSADYRQITLTGVKNAARYLKAFDVYVSPSVKEGFSWSILEAMAAKVPVIATRVGAAPEMIEDRVSGFLVEPENTEQIADRIRRLVANERLRKVFAIEGMQTATRRFNLEKMVRSIELLL